MSEAAPDRRSWIASLLQTNGGVTIAEITERFGVSRMTAHRDLDDLVHEGLARKVRGGASATPSTLFESDVRFRSTQEPAAKEALCRAAIEWLDPGMAVLLDESTTTLPLLERLGDIAPCTVVSNFRVALDQLADAATEDVEVLALGGRYHRRFESYTGPVCVAQLEGIHADVYVTSTTAVDDGAAWHPDADIAATKRAMLRAARTRLLLVDATKLGRAALYRVASLDEFDAVIVDGSTPSAEVDRLGAFGVDIHVAPPPDREDLAS